MSKEVFELGNRLKKIREKTGKTQEQFAEDSGIDRTYYGRVERGESNISSEKLLLMLKRNNILPDKFFGDWSEEDLSTGLYAAENPGNEYSG